MSTPAPTLVVNDGFYASLSLPFVTTTKDLYLVWNSIPTTFGFNTGVLDTTTGIATIPVDGIYSLQGSVMYEWNGVPAERLVSAKVEVNGSLTSIVTTQSVTTNDDTTLDFGATVSLKAGNTVRVKLQFPSLDPGQQVIKSIGTYFSIYRLS